MGLQRILPAASSPCGVTGTGAAGAPAAGTGAFLPLFDSAATRALEARAAAALPAGTLMQRAGLAVARLARALCPHARRVLVLAGPGNNGGDGFEAALHLHAHGSSQVQVLHLGDETRLPADARAALGRARAAGVVMSTGDAALDLLHPGDLLIDALLGRGLSRAPAGPMAELIARARAHAQARGVSVLAVDLPSGLPADSGAPATPGTVLPARATLALLSLPPGLFTAQGRAASGEVWFDDLGVVASEGNPPWADGGDQAPGLTAATTATTVCAATTVSAAGTDSAASNALADSAGPAACASRPIPPVALLGLRPERRPARAPASHKGSHGDLWVVGGAEGMVGAATLAARAGLCAGAGRVYLQRLAGGTFNDPVTPELMHPGSALADDDAWPARWAGATVVAGCGGGEAIGPWLPTVLAHAGRLVLDADALNLLAGRVPAAKRPGAPEPMADAGASPGWAALAARAARGLPTVITPHPLEAARLLGCSSAAVQADRLAAAQALAARCACVVVLKGSGSIVAAPACLPIVNTSGNAALATAGSGDVLAGWLGGLWSQQVGTWSAGTWSAGTWSTGNLQRLVHTAVWMHGHAAEQASPAGQALPASALIDQLGSLLRAGAL